MNDAQDATLAWLNDRWGVSHWSMDADGVANVTLDDGDETTIDSDGSCPMGDPLPGPGGHG